MACSFRLLRGGLIAAVAYIFSAEYTHSCAQSVPDTLNYLNGKLAAKKNEAHDYTFWFDIFSSSQPHLYEILTTDRNEHSGLMTFTSYKFDMRDILASGEYNDIYDRNIHLYCTDSSGECVKVIYCFDECKMKSKKSQAYLDVNLEMLTLYDAERAKRALLHLKTLSPTRQTHELFDQEK